MAKSGTQMPDCRAGLATPAWRLRQAARLGAQDLEVPFKAIATHYKAHGTRALRLGSWPRHARAYLTDATHRHAVLAKLIQKAPKSVRPAGQCTHLCVAGSPVTGVPLVT